MKFRGGGFSGALVAWTESLACLCIRSQVCEHQRQGGVASPGPLICLHVDAGSMSLRATIWEGGTVGPCYLSSLGPWPACTVGSGSMSLTGWGVWQGLGHLVWNPGPPAWRVLCWGPCSRCGKWEGVKSIVPLQTGPQGISHCTAGPSRCLYHHLNVAPPPFAWTQDNSIENSVICLGLVCHCRVGVYHQCKLGS